MALVEPSEAVDAAAVTVAVEALRNIAGDQGVEPRYRVDAARELLTYGVRHPYSEPPAE